MVKSLLVLLWAGGSGYKAYVFEESTKRYAIDRRGRGRKEVLYLRVADISCTRGVRRARGSPIEAPAVGFRNTTPPLIEAELWRRCSYYIYIKGTLKVLKRRKGVIY